MCRSDPNTPAVVGSVARNCDAASVSTEQSLDIREPRRRITAIHSAGSGSARLPQAKAGGAPRLSGDQSVAPIDRAKADPYISYICAVGSSIVYWAASDHLRRGWLSWVR
jgi:hypothetical protein